jgi:hypothetical protein
MWKYKRGKEIRVADALSIVKLKLLALSRSTTIPSWITEVVQRYQTDEKCKSLLAKQALDPNSEPTYTLKQGILRYNTRIVSFFCRSSN